MATGSDIVTKALRRSKIRAAETPIEPSELQDGIDDLNDMLAEWEGSGILLGYTPIKEPTDEVRIPRFANGCVAVNLAGRICSDYGKAVPASLAAEINGSTDNMLRALVGNIDVNFPGTLPLGSGNQCCEYADDRLFDQRFFDENNKENF